MCGVLTDCTEAERGGNEDGRDGEEERWSERVKRKTAERLQAVTADAKRGWQNVEQIFMDHERKSEKKIANKKTKRIEAWFQQLELIVLDD